MELETPKWHSPFPLTGSPSPSAPPRPLTPHPSPPTDCLTASTACLGSKKPTFPPPGNWGQGFSLEILQERKRKLRIKTCSRLCGDRVLWSAPPRPTPKCPYHLRAHFQPGLPPKPTAPSCHPDPFAYSDSIQWEKQTRRYSTRGLRLRHDSR